ncbi:unnamed protein product [Timema podura]|uniref:Serpin domain-containing protein n=1 Tax=Timema podura TaxID=61482 RepID=A0ABN7NFW8_TIMPD|nr:unnamed protein product [Timema podura]
MTSSKNVGLSRVNPPQGFEVRTVAMQGPFARHRARDLAILSSEGERRCMDTEFNFHVRAVIFHLIESNSGLRSDSVDNNHLSVWDVYRVFPVETDKLWEVAVLATQKNDYVFSPLSVRVVLSLLKLGARGETAERIAKLLALPSDRVIRKSGLSLILKLKIWSTEITFDSRGSKGEIMWSCNEDLGVHEIVEEGRKVDMVWVCDDDVGVHEIVEEGREVDMVWVCDDDVGVHEIVEEGRGG